MDQFPSSSGCFVSQLSGPTSTRGRQRSRLGSRRLTNLFSGVISHEGPSRTPDNRTVLASKSAALQDLSNQATLNNREDFSGTSDTVSDQLEWSVFKRKVTTGWEQKSVSWGKNPKAQGCLSKGYCSKSDRRSERQKSRFHPFGSTWKDTISSQEKILLEKGQSSVEGPFKPDSITFMEDGELPLQHGENMISPNLRKDLKADFSEDQKIYVSEQLRDMRKEIYHVLEEQKSRLEAIFHDYSKKLVSFGIVRTPQSELAIPKAFRTPHGSHARRTASKSTRMYTEMKATCRVLKTPRALNKRKPSFTSECYTPNSLSKTIADQTLALFDD